MKISSTSLTYKFKIIIAVIILGILVSFISYNIYLKNNNATIINREKLREIYELEIPRIDHPVRISMEYINKLEESLKKNLSEIKSISINDTTFQQFIDNAISYMKIAEKINDTWEKLKYIREAYFELERARAYYLFKKGELTIQTMYNKTHYVVKIFRNYKKEILEKDIYIGRDIDSAIVRSYEIEYLLAMGESYIYSAYRTLAMKELPVEMRIIDTAYYLAVIRTIIKDSSELYKEAFEIDNITSVKSYKQIIMNAYWEIHDLAEKIANEKLRNVDSKTYLYDLKDTVYGYIRSSEICYEQRYYSTALIEIIKAYARLQCIEIAKKVPSYEALNSQTLITLDELYRVKKELVDLIKEKLKNIRTTE